MCSAPAPAARPRPTEAPRRLAGAAAGPGGGAAAADPALGAARPGQRRSAPAGRPDGGAMALARPGPVGNRRPLHRGADRAAAGADRGALRGRLPDRRGGAAAFGAFHARLRPRDLCRPWPGRRPPHRPGLRSRRAGTAQCGLGSADARYAARHAGPDTAAAGVATGCAHAATARRLSAGPAGGPAGRPRLPAAGALRPGADRDAGA